MNEITKVIVGETEGVMKEAYKDIVSPSAKPIGMMLSYLPRTIRLCFSKWERWIINSEESLRLTGQALQEKVINIPEHKLCEPEPYVAIPAIQQIAYCFDSNDLRDMYANLLAASMNTDKKWSVHPSYVDIIKQLTPDEAKILKQLPRTSVNFIPIIDIKVTLANGKGEETIARNITQEALYNICDVPGAMCSYLDNLERLQLIKISDTSWLADGSLYDMVEASQRATSFKNRTLEDGQSYCIGKKLFYVTDFGVGFINCCIDE